MFDAFIYIIWVYPPQTVTTSSITFWVILGRDPSVTYWTWGSPTCRLTICLLPISDKIMCFDPMTLGKKQQFSSSPPWESRSIVARLNSFDNGSLNISNEYRQNYHVSLQWWATLIQNQLEHAYTANHTAYHTCFNSFIRSTAWRCPNLETPQPVPHRTPNLHQLPSKHKTEKGSILASQIFPTKILVWGWSIFQGNLPHPQHPPATAASRWQNVGQRSLPSHQEINPTSTAHEWNKTLNAWRWYWQVLWIRFESKIGSKP